MNYYMTRAALILLLAVAASYSLWFLTVGLSNQTLDIYAFRQAQTAISAYWLAKGGSWLNYETPVLGYPWSIPFEFPTYQAAVAALFKLGVPLVVAGRTISYVLFLSCLFPTWVLFKKLELDVHYYIIFCILFVGSPLYIFWSRSLMIESTALFFSMAWVCILVQISPSISINKLLLCLLLGSVAALTKSTTFLVWGVLGFGWACVILFQYRKSSDFSKILMGLLFSGIMPLVVGYIWVRYSDIIKSHNDIAGTYLLSKQLNSWNFGTLNQRLSSDFWDEAVSKRMLRDIFGYGLIAGAVAIGVTLNEKRNALFAVLAVCIYIASFLIFSNLYFVHYYYQVASAVFVLFAAALGLGQLVQRGKALLGVVLTMFICIGQLAYANNVYLPNIKYDNAGQMKQQAGIAAKEIASPNEAILVFGDDWSSEILYYAERRGLAVPDWLSEEKIATIILSSDQLFGGERLGAILDCRVPSSSGKWASVDRWLSTKSRVASAGNCNVYR